VRFLFCFVFFRGCPYRFIYTEWCVSFLVVVNNILQTILCRNQTNTKFKSSSVGASVSVVVPFLVLQIGRSDVNEWVCGSGRVDLATTFTLQANHLNLSALCGCLLVFIFLLVYSYMNLYTKCYVFSFISVWNFVFLHTYKFLIVGCCYFYVFLFFFLFVLLFNTINPPALLNWVSLPGLSLWGDRRS